MIALPQRILDQIVPVTESGCWLWTGALNTSGYAHTCWQGKRKTVHRLMWETMKGNIPAGLMIDHLCRVPFCLNPDHMEVVTHKVNVLRGIGPTAQNATKTHCLVGHAFTPENTYKNGPNGRGCYTCQLHRSKLWKRKKRLEKKLLTLQWTAPPA